MKIKGFSIYFFTFLFVFFTFTLLRSFPTFYLSIFRFLSLCFPISFLYFSLFSFCFLILSISVKPAKQPKKTLIHKEFNISFGCVSIKEIFYSLFLPFIIGKEYSTNTHGNTKSYQIDNSPSPIGIKHHVD